MVTETTPLLDIVCYYRNALTDEIVQIDGSSIEILRPVNLSPADKVVNLMVDRQRNRVGVAESIAKAKELADKGHLKEAKEVLDNSRESLRASALAKSSAGGEEDDMFNCLVAELEEVTARMENMGLYDREGRAFMLSSLSEHLTQRATTRRKHTSREVGGRAPRMQMACTPARKSACCGAGRSRGGGMGSGRAGRGGGVHDTPRMRQMLEMAENSDKKEEEEETSLKKRKSTKEQKTSFKKTSS